MADGNETLFLDESQGSFDLKMVRLARAFRSEAIANAKAQILCVGYVSCRIRSDFDAGEARNALGDLARRAKAALTACGVFQNAIAGYILIPKVPAVADFVALSLRPEGAGAIPGGTSTPATGGAKPKGGGGDDPVTTEIAIDPFKKEVKASFPKVELEIDVKFWDDKGIGGVLPKKAKVTFDVDSKQINDTALELQWAKDFLKNKMLWGVVSKAEVSVTASGKVNFSQDDKNRTTANLSAEIKAAVEVGIKIPKLPMDVKVEANVTLDTAGKVTPGATLTFPLPWLN